LFMKIPTWGGRGEQVGTLLTPPKRKVNYQNRLGKKSGEKPLPRETVKKK